mmetsp:Transcript_27020/g.48132  ORF Transcript_27020/g.48132 Transcript_27020/m.48132 type:complete len:309 (-) Transcript_27020:1764-2690(-)
MRPGCDSERLKARKRVVREIRQRVDCFAEGAGIALGWGQRRDVEEALRRRFPGKLVLLLVTQRLGFVLPGVLHFLRKLLRCAVHQTVGKLREEAVGGMLAAYNKLSHSQRLRARRGNHVTGGWVHQHLVVMNFWAEVVLRAVEFQGERETSAARLDVRKIWAATVDIHRNVFAARVLVLLHHLQELSVPFGPHHLAYEVKPIGETFVRSRLGRSTVHSNLEERRADAVHKLGVLFREGLHSSRQFHNLVAVSLANPGVYDFQHVLLHLAALFSPRVVQVVGVHNAHDVVEFVGPATAVVIPVQVFRLL